MAATNMVVYFDPACTPCERVIQYSRYYNIEMDWKNVDEPGVRDELIAATGQETIPALVVNGTDVVLGEGNIVTYILDNYAAEEGDVLAEEFVAAH